MSNTLPRVGYISMLMYAVVTALSSMLIHVTNQRVTPLLSAFYTFLFCLLTYNIITRGPFSKLNIIWQSWFNILMLNITTAICWIFTFFALKIIQPELFLYIYLCAMPIASSLIYKTQLLKASIYFIGLIFLTLTYHAPMLYVGALLAFVGGLSGTIYSIYSKKVTGKFSTIEILSLRFYLTVAITFFLSCYLNQITLMDANYYLDFAILSFVSVICPLLLFQIGIKHLTVVKALSYLPLAPLLCYIINIVFNHAPFYWTQLCAIMFISIAMII
jgi:drug/metabolite transporter (DMT)-like permease